MRISIDTAARLQQLLSRNVNQTETADSASRSAQTPASEDEVRLSPGVQLVQSLHDAVRQLNDVDETRVRSIAQQLKQGTYDPNVKDVAQSILKELGG